MSHKMKSVFGNIGYYAISVSIAIIVMIPFFWMISTSLKSKGALMALPVQWIPEEPTLNAYAQVFQKFPFLKAVGNSLFITICYTLITILSCSMAAFAFTKIKFPFCNGLFKVYLASMMIPTQVTLIPLFIIMRNLGLVDSYTSVVTPSLFKAFGIFLLVQNMRSVPNDFIEAAKIDGAGLWYIYRRIMLPLTSPAILTLSITTFMDSWNDYLWSLVMLTDRDKMTITLALNTLNGQYATEYNILMAGSIISMIPIILVYIGANSKMKTGIMVGGVKG